MSSSFAIRKCSRSQKRSGFSLVEVALSLAIVGLATAGLVQGADDASRQIKDSATADRLNQVYNAAEQYVSANTGLVTSVPVGGSVQLAVARTSASASVPTNSLQSQGYLPSSFVDTNSYGQNSVVIIRQPTAGNIEALVSTTGGQTISDVDLGRIAAKVGANGGVVDTTPPPGIASGTMMGTGGGWSEPATDWTTGGVTPTAGHAVAVNYVSQVNSLAPYLYRNDIGIHEANTMHTAIDMTHNALDSVGSIDNTDQTTGTNAPITVGSELAGSTSGGVVGQVQVENGLDACTAGTTGCQLTVSTKAGSLQDNGDGWMTAYNANTGGGLHISGPGDNLKVDGTSTLTGAVDTYDGVALYNGGTLTWPGNSSAYVGPKSGSSTMLEVYGGGLYAATVLEAPTITGDNLVQGPVINASQQMQAPIYYGPSGTYYLQPDSTSYVNDLDANEIHSYDNVTANGALIAGGANGTDISGPGITVDSSGNETLAGALNATTVTASGMVSGNGVATNAGATAGQACTTAGEIAQDTAGRELDSCESGIWVGTSEFTKAVAQGVSAQMTAEQQSGTDPASYEAVSAYQTNSSGGPELVTAFTDSTCLQYGISVGANVNGTDIAINQGFNSSVTFVIPAGTSWYYDERATADASSVSCLPDLQIYNSIWQ